MKTKETDFGSRLRKYRKQSGLTTQELAKLCGVAESTYREWEYGREIRGLKAYEILAKTFEVSFGELMMGEKAKLSSIHQDLKNIEDIVKAIRIKL